MSAWLYKKFYYLPDFVTMVVVATTIYAGQFSPQAIVALAGDLSASVGFLFGFAQTHLLIFRDIDLPFIGCSLGLGLQLASQHLLPLLLGEHLGGTVFVGDTVTGCVLLKGHGLSPL